MQKIKEIKDNFSIQRLFVTKEIKVSLIGQSEVYTIIMYAPLVCDLIKNTDIGTAHEYLTNSNVRKQIFENKEISALSSVKTIIFDLGQFSQYKTLYSALLYTLGQYFPSIVYKYDTKDFIINDIKITDDIWDYLIYVLKLSCGEKASKPQVVDKTNPMMLAQSKLQEKINAIKNNSSDKQLDNCAVIKSLLTIMYQFPSFTIDYLLNQTLAQIRWLQEYAAKSVSYEVSANALAAGNMKKDFKLEFFIK